MRCALACVVVVLVACFFMQGSTNVSAEVDFDAKAAIVMESTSRRVLQEKNADQRLPMASTTKIATALMVIKCCADLDEIITVPAEACGIEGSSAYLCEGERLSVTDLLYGLMLRSGNDCAVALAIAVCGNVSDFVARMNCIAAELGCSNTHFVNPHGLHDDMHYTSARDLAIITCEAYKYDLFAAITSARSYRVTTDESNKVFVNKNKLLGRYELADGVKTGYTKRAGRCFVGSASRNGMRLIAVVLNCAPMFEQTQQALEWAFDRYTQKRFFKNQLICSTSEQGKRMFLYLPCELYLPVYKSEQVKIETLREGNEYYACFRVGNFCTLRLLSRSPVG